MIVECIERADQFAALADEWEGLLALSPRPSIFLSWPWISSWWEVYGERRRLVVLTVREAGGRLAGLLPAHISERIAFRWLPVRTLAFLGQGEGIAADHMDLLAEPSRAAEVAGALAGWLCAPRAGWDTLELTAVAPDSAVVRHLGPELAVRRLRRQAVTPHSRCPYFALPEDAGSFWNALSSSFRKNLRRYRRKTEEEFKTQLRRCEDRRDLATAMSELARLHNLRKNQQGLPGKFEDARYQRFHELVSGRMFDLGRLALYSLVLNGRWAAAEYCFQYGGVLYEYQTGFDTEFERYGAMNVLDSYVVEDAIGRGLTEVDLLRGEEAYKQHWTKTARDQMTLLVESRTPRGRLHGVMRGLRARLGSRNAPAAIRSPAS